jgi:hypothetical protein
MDCTATASVRGLFFTKNKMAIFRKVHTSFWSDPYTAELDPDKKFFYLYLITNERTTQCGIYEITKRQMSFDTGYSMDRVSKLLQYFIDTGKIMYSERTNELAVKNWPKFNYSSSPKVQACINKELTQVKNTVLIEYLKGMHTASQEEQEQEQEQEEEKEEEKDAVSKKPEFTHNLQKFIFKNCPSVSKMKKQITHQECERLLEKYSGDAIRDKLAGMENIPVRRLTSRYSSVYLTLSSWLKRDHQESPSSVAQPKQISKPK